MAAKKRKVELVERVRQDPSNPEYTIVGVDYNERETVPWLKFIADNCPRAQVVTINDTRPVGGCTTCAKMLTFNMQNIARPDRVIFLDSDTLVFKDLGPVFSIMGKSVVGVSLKDRTEMDLFEFHRFASLRLPLHDAMRVLGIEKKPTYYMSGMIVLKGADPRVFAHGWANMTNILNKIPPQNFYYDEITLSFWLAAYFDEENIWRIPGNVHDDGWLRSEQDYRFEDIWVLHYHDAKRLRNRPQTKGLINER